MITLSLSVAFSQRTPSWLIMNIITEEYWFCYLKWFLCIDLKILTFVESRLLEALLGSLLFRFMAYLGRWISLSFIKIVTILHMILVCLYLATMWYFPQRDIVHKPNQVCLQLASPSPSYLDVFVMPKSESLHCSLKTHSSSFSANMLTIDFMTFS